jgi:hypothetical protein
MDSLIKNLRELNKLLKASGGNFVPPKVQPKALQTLPSIKAPKAPSLAPKAAKAPKLPGIAPGSAKDPKKMAEQLKNPQQRVKTMKQLEVTKCDHNGQWKIEKADDTTEPVKGPLNLDSMNVVHGKNDALAGGFAHSPEQHSLVHGLDFKTAKSLNGGQTGSSAWLKSPHHEHQVLMKPASGLKINVRDPESGETIVPPPDMVPSFGGHDSMNAPKREVLYHNLANKLFGMGQYVPTTAIVNKQGDHWSAQKMVGGHHGAHSVGEGKTSMSPKYKEAINHLHGNGELHKLGLMNNIMANHDRHSGNVMLDNKEPKLHMIDNSLAFDHDNLYREDRIPAYLKHADELGLDNTKLHPEAKKWLDSLDENKAKALMKEHGYGDDSRFTKGLMSRIQSLKENSNKQHGSINELLENSIDSTMPEEGKKKGAA